MSSITWVRHLILSGLVRWMAYDGSNRKYSEKGEWSPASKHHLPFSVWVWRISGLRGTGQQKLTREIKLWGANGDWELFFFSGQLTTARTDYHARLTPTLPKHLTIQTYTRIVKSVDDTTHTSSSCWWMRTLDDSFVSGVQTPPAFIRRKSWVTDARDIHRVR